MKKLAVIAATVGLVLGVSGIVGYASVHGGYSTYTIDETKTIPSENVDNIQFTSSLAGVHIYPTDSDKITVHLHGGTTKKDIVVIAKANGASADIEIRHKNENMINFFPFEFMGNSLKVDLEIPKKVYHQFQAESQAGSITMESLEAKQFDLHASAGSINGSDLKGDLTAHSSAGSITLSNIDGKLNLTDSAGSINVQLPSILKDINAESSAGSVRIVTQEEPKALKLDLYTSAGRADVNLPGASYSIKESDNLVGEIGSGGPTVQLKSSAGSVSISKQ